MEEVAQKNQDMPSHIFTLPAPVGLAAFAVSELRGLGKPPDGRGVFLLRSEDVFRYLGISIDSFKREYKGAICLGRRPADAMVNRDRLTREAMERSNELLWKRHHKKAHIVLPTTVMLTKDEFLAENKHWLDLFHRIPFDEEAMDTVQTYMLQKIDQDTARLVPDQYRTRMAVFCRAIKDTDRQNWLQQTALTQVAVNRHVPLPKMVADQPVCRVARQLEDLAFKLKSKSSIEAIEAKKIADTLAISCHMQYQTGMASEAKMEAMMARFEALFQKVEPLNGAAMTGIIEDINKEHQKQFTEFRALANDAHDENGERARQMTDKQWLFRYRNLNEANIQKWIDHFVDQSRNPTGISDSWKALIMDTGGERLERVLNNAMFPQS
ncbi:hypothetical protein CDV31_016099 [Fusarium ambrosium]|uniref:Uncharacterized protein n=1 Tax=Fusarium ambrosium TaxID=131363 RepID=A0A428SEM6_9HYPO|nr:hypothetical protein CDV31_016099 [Fusarium ambrosium]